MKLIYCLLILLCPYPGISQLTNISPVNIGDRFPGIICNNVLNYSAASIDISQFKDRLVILDFMLTTCSSCLGNLARFDALQKLYKGKLQFIIITTQKKEIVKAFLQKSSIGKQINFPVITADDKLKLMFPHEYISHLVWIGRDGIVKAITHGEYVTAPNVLSILEGKSNHWPVKRDVPDFDYNRPSLILNDQIKSIKKLSPLYTAILPYIPEVGQYFIVQKDSMAQTVRTAFVNQPITEMYLRLVGKIRFPHTRIVLEVRDSSRFIFDDTKFYRREWDEKNTFCYESVLPAAMSLEERQARIFNDLDFYFGINARLEERILSCLVLRRTKQSHASPPISGDSLTLWAIINQLNATYSGKPVFNSVPGTDRTWIAATHKQVSDMAELKKVLLASGFELIPEMRTVEALVISEQSFSTKQTKKS